MFSVLRSSGRAAFRALLLPGLIAAAAPVLAAPVLPDFSRARFARGAAIDNAYFPLVPGTRNLLIARGVEDGEPFTERTVLTARRAGPKILGVKVRTQVDKAYEDDLLVEKTFDYFAQDTRGNVWYMGEDVTNYDYDDDGELTGTDTESSWRAGKNGALPGFIMPDKIRTGFNYYQEFAAADDALDQATISGILAHLKVDGATYANVLRIFESSEIEPDLREYKYYAPGIGLIRAEEGLDANFGNPELVANRVAPVPVPAPLALIIAGVGALCAVARRRRDTAAATV